jgi:quercetin dioxygenase-like cupin family protein
MPTQITSAEFSLVRASEARPFSQPEPGLWRRVLAANEKLMLVEHRMNGGWVGKAHSHPHDQLVYVISGKLEMSAAGQSFKLSAGDSFVVRGGVEHQASAVEPSHVLDVFTPRREDY